MGWSMRIRLHISKENRKKLPFDYQYGLASVLYHRIREESKDLAQELHSRHSYKFYTFSWLEFEEGNTKEGLDFEDAWFYVSSPHLDYIQILSDGFLNNPLFYLRGIRMEVKEISCLNRKKIGGQAKFKTLSPIYLKTVKNGNGKKKEWDLYPEDDKWSENLGRNLIKRYNAFCGESRKRGYDFQLLSLGQERKKRVTIAGSHRRCAMLTLEVKAPSDLLRFGYEAGFGEKTAMGFGCMEVI